MPAHVQWIRLPVLTHYVDYFGCVWPVTSLLTVNAARVAQFQASPSTLWTEMNFKNRCTVQRARILWDSLAEANPGVVLDYASFLPR